MACKSPKETWDKLKEKFHGDEKSRKMQILNLRRQFEGLKMKETETIKDFSSQISKLVNQVRFLGEDFPDSRIVKKVLVSLLKKYEHKICFLEDSKDFFEISLQELVNALQAVEQRQAYRQEGSSEGALVTVYKEKSRAKNFYRNNQEGEREKGKEKKREVDNLIIGNRTTTSSLEGKRRKNIFLLANSVRKQIILKSGVGSRMHNAEIASNLITSKDSAKTK